jgi:hypothetical protein
MRCRVVWGLGETMASFWPRSRLRSVDFPTFGRPIRLTKPARCGASPEPSEPPKLIDESPRG